MEYERINSDQVIQFDCYFPTLRPSKYAAKL